MEFEKRSGVGTAVIAGIVILVIVVAGVGAFLFLNSTPPTQPTTTTSSSSSSSSSSPSSSSSSSSAASSSSSSATQSSSSSAPPPIVSVTSELSFLPSPSDMIPYVAAGQKFFAQQGLNVTIIPNAQGSVGAVQAVAAGKVDFADADGGTLASLLITQNVTNVRAVAVILNRSPNAVLYNKDRNISKVQDLQGKTLGGFAGSSEAQLFPLVEAKNGIDPSKVNFQPVAASAVNAGLISGKFDAIFQFTQNVPVVTTSTTPHIGLFLFSDYGADTMGLTVITSTNMINNHPDVVKRYVTAYCQALAFAAQNPAPAVRTFVDAVPTLNYTLSLAEWSPYNTILLAFNASQIPKLSNPAAIGWIDPNRANATVQIIAKATGHPPIDPALFYTDQFVPHP